MNLNPSEIPSLSTCLDQSIEDVEMAPGRVLDDTYRLSYTFSVPTDEVGKMTAKEIFLLYLKPVVDNYFGPAILNLYDKHGPLCTKALPLPDAKSRVIGFRCWQGKVPVNIYIARRPDPDRHQFILDTIVYPAKESRNEA
jgi:hypothetical protein